jgi:hypothetical protein
VRCRQARGEASGNKRIGGLEGADQRQAKAFSAASMLHHQALAEAVLVG